MRQAQGKTSTSCSNKWTRHGSIENWVVRAGAKVKNSQQRAQILQCYFCSFTRIFIKYSLLKTDSYF